MELRPAVAAQRSERVSGQAFGMQSLDSCLLDLTKRGLIDYEVALGKTSNPLEFRQRAERLGLTVDIH